MREMHLGPQWNNMLQYHEWPPGKTFFRSTTQFQFPVLLCYVFLLVLRNSLSLVKPPVLMGLANVAADASKI